MAYESVEPVELPRKSTGVVGASTRVVPGTLCTEAPEVLSRSILINCVPQL